MAAQSDVGSNAALKYPEAVIDTVGTAQASFVVSAIWDDEVGVFYSVSNLPGLHVEAATFEEFVRLVHELAPGMIADNTNLAPGPVSISVNARRDIVLSAA